MKHPDPLRLSGTGLPSFPRIKTKRGEAPFSFAYFLESVNVLLLSSLTYKLTLRDTHKNYSVLGLPCTCTLMIGLLIKAISLYFLSRFINVLIFGAYLSQNMFYIQQTLISYPSLFLMFGCTYVAGNAFKRLSQPCYLLSFWSLTSLTHDQLDSGQVTESAS